MNHRDRRRRFALELLEMRIALSGSAPANVDWHVNGDSLSAA